MRPAAFRTAVVMACAIWCGACAAAAPVLGAWDLRRLIVMDDRLAAPLAVEQLEWAGGGALILSGWERWPDQPALVAFEAAAQIPLALRPLHFFPRFVLSPDGRSLTCWHRVGDEMGGQAQLTSIDLASGNVTGLGGPQRFLAGGRLVIAAPGVVIAACQPEGGGTLLYKAVQGECSLLARLEGMTCEDLLAEPDGEHIVVVCAGDPERHYRINWRAGVWAEVEPSAHRPPDAPALPAGMHFDATTGRLIRIVGVDERVVLAEGVEAVCGREGTNAVIYAAGGALRVTDAAGEFDRRLWGAAGQPDARATRLAWSPDGCHIAHCYRSGDIGSVRRASLGTETVTVTLSFGEGTSVKVGDAVWVAERYAFDGRGHVVEPVWSTLKALLRVEQVALAERGRVVEAVSEGVEGGVVERLTGSNQAPPGAETGGHIAIGSGTQPPANWMQTFTAEPRPDLSGWMQGDTGVGRLLAVKVTRRRLMPLTP